MSRLISKLSEIIGKYAGGTFLERKEVRRRSLAGRSIKDVVTISDEARRRLDEESYVQHDDGHTGEKSQNRSRS